MVEVLHVESMHTQRQDRRVTSVRTTHVRRCAIALTAGLLAAGCGRSTRQPLGPADSLASFATEHRLPTLRNALASADKRLPARDIVSIENILERGLTHERMVAPLAGSFRLVALLSGGGPALRR